MTNICVNNFLRFEDMTNICVNNFLKFADMTKICVNNFLKFEDMTKICVNIVIRCKQLISNSSTHVCKALPFCPIADRSGQLFDKCEPRLL